jgi:ATP-dependent Clp protease ATP-binding subunit ClpA
MFERFTKEARAVVLAAARLAADSGEPKARPEHLLLAVAGADGTGQRILAGYHLTEGALTAAIRPRGPVGLTEDEISALREVGIDTDELFRRLEETFGPGALDEPTAAKAPRRRGRLGGPFDQRSKKVLELSLREAIALGHKEISTAHLVLAVLRAGVCEPLLAVLTEHGVSYDDVRKRVRTELDGAA